MKRIFNFTDDFNFYISRSSANRVASAGCTTSLPITVEDDASRPDAFDEFGENALFGFANQRWTLRGFTPDVTVDSADIFS